jgi:hypothetical protein
MFFEIILLLEKDRKKEKNLFSKKEKRSLNFASEAPLLLKLFRRFSKKVKEAFESSIPLKSRIGKKEGMMQHEE